MQTMSNLQKFNAAMNRFQAKTRLSSIRDMEMPQVQTEQKAIVYLSIGQLNQRAKVFHQISDKSYEQALEKVSAKALKWINKYQPNLDYLKVDFVTQIEETTLLTLQKQIQGFKKNYFRRGLSFDTDFSLSFLEQEVVGNAFIREATNGTMGIDEVNILHYLKTNRYKVFNFNLSAYNNKPIYLFDTAGYFFDFTEQRQWKTLQQGELSNGVRQTANLKKEIEQIVKKATHFLAKEIQPSGQFNYGYFSAFAKPIGTYNILRHASSVYAMLEGYEVLKKKDILIKAQQSLTYLMTAIVFKDVNTAYVVDKENNNEIKLGSNATAILAMTKYAEVSGDKSYNDTAEKLANGIIAMRNDETGHYNHVLNYPDFTIKDKFRIIYYEGEAVFALLRLYQLDGNKKWIDEVVSYFEIFIAEEYWKEHDHWLSYAVNELTDYLSEDKYYQFGLKNCADKLAFIYHRETTFATFLELTMAAYKMIDKIKQADKAYLLNDFDEELLLKTIDKRAQFQRVGFMYPEVAMYFKQPALVLNGFFIRHQSLRVRIDDVEHNLSGYIQYLTYRLGESTT